jgi:hypothetical protein
VRFPARAIDALREFQFREYADLTMRSSLRQPNRGFVNGQRAAVLIPLKVSFCIPAVVWAM